MECIAKDKNLKILIATPAKHYVSTEYAKCLVDLITHLSKEFTGQFEYRQDQGSCIPEQRNRLVLEAMALGCTHILWLDSDMMFPPNIVHKLLSFNAAIAAATYYNAYDRSINHVVTPTETYASLGCSLVKLSVYNTLGIPYHTFGWNALERKHTSEWRELFKRLPKGIPVKFFEDPEVKHLHHTYI